MVKVTKINELEGHKDSIYVVEPVSDTQFLSSGGDGMVALWTLGAGKDAALVAKVPNSVYAIKYVPEKSKALVGHNYEGIHEIDILEKKETRNVKCVEGSIFAIEYYEGEIYVGDNKGVLTVIDFDSFTVKQRIQLSTKSLRTITFFNQNIVVGTSDNQIILLDADKKIKKVLEKAHQKSVFALNKYNDKLYSVSGDAHIKEWDTDLKMIDDVIAHMYAIHDIAFRQDFKYFATCSMDKTIKIWDTQTNQLLKVIDAGRFGSHKSSVNKLWWSPFKDQLVSCSDDRKIMIWDINIKDNV